MLLEAGRELPAMAAGDPGSLVGNRQNELLLTVERVSVSSGEPDSRQPDSSLRRPWSLRASALRLAPRGQWEGAEWS